MEYILNLLPLTAEEKEQFLAVKGDDTMIFAPNANKEDGTLLEQEYYEKATVILGNGPVEYVRTAAGLKWLQTRTAGVDTYMPRGIIPDDAILTSAVGAYGHGVAEHLFAATLAIMKNLHLYRDQQNQTVWNDLGPITSLEDATVLVIGTGDIGSWYARMCKALGSHTLGVRRNKDVPAEGIDEMYDFSSLDSLIPKADIIAMLVPATAETYHLMNAERLAMMKKTAFLVNAGRGTAIDPEALNDVLSKELIAGAAIDVTEPEPLPAESPLWKQPKLLITPHIAGGDHLYSVTRNIVALAYRNLLAFKNGTPMQSVVRRG